MVVGHEGHLLERAQVAHSEAGVGKHAAHVVAVKAFAKLEQESNLVAFGRGTLDRWYESRRVVVSGHAPARPKADDTVWQVLDRFKHAE